MSLGPAPLANSFPASPTDFEHELRFPLDVAFCRDCALVQLLDVIDPDVLFRDYIYVSGTSETMLAHYREYVQTAVEWLGLEADDFVVEVASNDGSLLRCFQECGMRTLGIEPASNIAEQAAANGVETLNEFLSSSTAESVRESHGPAAAVIANNVLAHVDETSDFLQGCRALLAQEGVLIVEVPYLGNLVRELQYDTIYHEHVCYFAVHSLLRLFENARLSVARVESIPIHGGSLRVYARRIDSQAVHAPEARRLAETEARRGMTRLSTFEDFASRVNEHRTRLRELLMDLKRDSKSVAAYGAPAKGNTLLNFCDIDQRFVSYCVDKNPWKVGRYTPGTHLPVLPVSTLGEHPPDCLLLLPWNLADEILRQQSAYRRRGGQFILPIPEPRVI